MNDKGVLSVWCGNGGGDLTLYKLRNARGMRSFPLQFSPLKIKLAVSSELNTYWTRKENVLESLIGQHYGSAAHYRFIVPGCNRRRILPTAAGPQPFGGPNMWIYITPRNVWSIRQIDPHVSLHYGPFADGTAESETSQAADMNNQSDMVMCFRDIPCPPSSFGPYSIEFLYQPSSRYRSLHRVASMCFPFGATILCLQECDCKPSILHGRTWRHW